MILRFWKHLRWSATLTAQNRRKVAHFIALCGRAFTGHVTGAYPMGGGGGVLEVRSPPPPTTPPVLLAKAKNNNFSYNDYLYINLMMFSLKDAFPRKSPRKSAVRHILFEYELIKKRSISVSKNSNQELRANNYKTSSPHHPPYLPPYIYLPSLPPSLPIST